jgi:cytochrome P450
MTTTVPDRSHAPLDTDISARTFWAKPYEEREQTFAWLRANEPVSYHRPYESTLVPPEPDSPGFWALTKHEDCVAVSRNQEDFTSTAGVIMENFPEVVIVASHSFLAMDDPDHNRLRSIVSRAFTAKRTRTMEGWIQSVARDLVDEMIERGKGEFCELFAKQMPGRIFAHFFGVEPGSEEAETIMDAAEKMLAWDDPRCAQGRDALFTFAEEAERIQDVALAVAEQRLEEPAEDMVSWVVHAEVDGERMEEWEIAAFFSLLGSAANDTTRHSLAHAIRLFSEHPDQLALLMEDFDGRVTGAVEEVLRHSTPVMHFRRTARRDTRIRGVDIKEGDKVVMWYCSGNRDEDVFPDSGRFDILRENARSHMAFGAGGAHFCIGAALGRSMIAAGLREIYTRMPDITLAGEPEIQINHFMHGVHAMPVRWTPPSPG